MESIIIAYWLVLNPSEVLLSYANYAIYATNYAGLIKMLKDVFSRYYNICLEHATMLLKKTATNSKDVINQLL